MTPTPEPTEKGALTIVARQSAVCRLGLWGRNDEASGNTKEISEEILAGTGALKIGVETPANAQLRVIVRAIAAMMGTEVEPNTLMAVGTFKWGNDYYW